MSSHAVNALGSDVSAFLRSAGSSCTTPLEIFLCDMEELSQRTASAYVPEVGPLCGFPVEAGARSSREAAATLPCARSSVNFAIS